MTEFLGVREKCCRFDSISMWRPDVDAGSDE
jgi:hypothetical protein